MPSISLTPNIGAGETITADDMATAAETISYEITSGLTARVDRYWINASQ